MGVGMREEREEGARSSGGGCVTNETPCHFWWFTSCGSWAVGAVLNHPQRQEPTAPLALRRRRPKRWGSRFA